MTRIEDNEQYVLIPKHEDDLDLKSRGFYGKALKELFSEEKLIDALDTGKTLIYKGNEYFLDIKL